MRRTSRRAVVRMVLRPAIGFSLLALVNGAGYAVDCKELASGVAQDADISDPEKIARLEGYRSQCEDTGYYEYFLGGLYGTQEKYEDSVRTLKKATQVELPTEYARSARLALAEAFMLMRENQPAMEQFARLIRDYPDWAYGQYSFGQFLIATENYEKAVTHLRHSHRLQPDQYKVMRSLATAHFFLQEHEEVHTLMQQAYERVGDRMFADRTLVAIAARSHLAMGNPVHAEDLLGALLNADPDARKDAMVRKAIALVQDAKNRSGGE